MKSFGNPNSENGNSKKLGHWLRPHHGVVPATVVFPRVGFARFPGAGFQMNVFLLLISRVFFALYALAVSRHASRFAAFLNLLLRGVLPFVFVFSELGCLCIHFDLRVKDVLSLLVR